MASDSGSSVGEQALAVTTSKDISVSTGGAQLVPENLTRKVKIYPIQEHELTSLDDLGKNSTIWAAIGAGAVTLATNCIWDIFKSTPTSPVSIEEKGFMWLMIAAFTVSSAVSWWYERRRKTRLQTIVSECEVIVTQKLT